MILEASFALRRGGFHLEVDLSLDSPVTALFGPSGSGKTTLLHAVAGLLRPDRGRIAVGGQVCAEPGVYVPAHRRRVAVVFQDLRLFPHRSVRDNLLYGWRLLPDHRRRLDPADVVEALEIGPLMERAAQDLSGGERQRVALGRALLAMPDLLLMDEPLASVDMALRRQILPYLRSVLERTGIPVLYVSHSLPEFLELTERVVVLEAGRVVGQGEVFEVLSQTLHGPLGEPFSTDTLLRVKILEVHEDGRWVRGAFGDQSVTLPFAPLSVGDRGRVTVRPEDVILASSPLSRISARNQLRGQVERITGLHGRPLVHVRLGEDATLRAEVTQDALDELDLKVGAEVFCVVKTSAFRWWRY